MNVPLHCLVTVSVSMHAGQLGLSHSETPKKRPSPQAHAARVIHLLRRCRRRSTQDPPVEDNLDALGGFIATAAVRHLPEKPLVEN